MLVPTAVKVPPVAPGARQMSYPLTARSSVEGVQVSVAEPQLTLAVGVPGTVGGCVSGGGQGGGNSVDRRGEGGGVPGRVAGPHLVLGDAAERGGRTMSSW